MTQDFKLDMTMMFAFHDALRRDLDRAAGLTTRTEGWDLFERLLHVHHTSEDEALWPVVRDVTDHPNDLALLDEMAAEHATIDPLLIAIDEALNVDTARLGELVGKLDAELRHHLDHEERDALPLIDRTLSEEQWIGSGEAATKALGPDGPRFFPWLLDGVDAETTERLLGMLPEPVQQTYRNEWQPAYAAVDRWATKSSVA